MDKRKALHAKGKPAKRLSCNASVSEAIVAQSFRFHNLCMFDVDSKRMV